MKILGNASNGYIVEVSFDEMTKMTGQSSVTKWDWRTPAFNIGQSIPVATVWDSLKKVLSARDKLTETAAALRACATLAETSVPVLEEVQTRGEEAP